MRPSLSVAVLTSGLAFAAGPLRADVDVEVPVPAKLAGSLADGEVETVRFFAPARSVLSAKLATKKKAGVDVALRLLDPDGVEQPLPASNVTDKGASIKLRKLTLGRTGTWSLRVSGQGAGDYKLAVKVKPPKKLSFDVDLTGEAVPVAIPCAFGSTLRITAKPPRGSAAVPVLRSFDGDDISSEGKRTDGTHKVTVVAGASGDLTLDVAPDGADGPVGVTVAIKPPKVKALTRDISGEALGRPAGGETIVGRVIEPEAGGEVSAGPESDIFGASIRVEPGALTEPALVTMSSTDPTPIIDPDSSAAGPTVQIQAPITDLALPATVTLPLAGAPVQTTADDVMILQEGDDGSSQIFAPDTVDLDAGTTTFPISSFAAAKSPALTTLRFTPIAPAGSPPLAGRSYWGFAFDANLVDDPTGRDESGLRRVSAADVLLDFDPDGTTWTARLDERQVLFGLERDPQDEVLVPVSDVTQQTSQDSGTWAYGPGGRRVRLFFDSEPGEDRLFVSRDGSILLNTTEEPEEGVPDDALLDLFVERPAAADPTALLTGTYHFGELSVSLRARDDGALAEMELLSSIGTVTFRQNGKLAFDLKHVEAFGVVETSPSVFDLKEFAERGSVPWAVETNGPYAGAARVDVEGDSTAFRIFSHRDGRMFVMSADSGGGELALLVGVRVSSGRDVSDLDGNHAVGTCFFALNEYQIEDGQPGSGAFRFAPDFGISSESSRLLFDGAGGVTLSARSSLLQDRDPATPGGVRRDRRIGPDIDFDYALAKNGAFEFLVEGNELRGGVTPDASFGFAIQDPDDPTFGLILFVNRPPQQP